MHNNFIAAPLSVDVHLKLVRQVTWGLRTKWYHLGIMLGINIGTLQVSY